MPAGPSSRLIAAAIVLVAMLCGASGSTASTIAGEAAGKLPRLDGSAAGAAQAIETRSSRIAAAERLARSGRYRLSVPAGLYVVTTSVMGARRVLSSRPVLARGKRVARVDTTLKRTRPAKKPRKRRPRATAAAEAKLLLSVHGSMLRSPTEGDIRFDGALISYLFETRSPCAYSLFADRESRDFKAIQAEVALQRKHPGAFDPSTVVKPKWHLPQYTPTTRISGQFTEAAGRFSGTLTATDLRNGKLLGSSRVASVSDAGAFLDGAAIRAALSDLLSQLCPDLPERFSGTFSGSDTRELGSSATWNGSVVFKRGEEISDPVSQIRLVRYTLESGSVSWSVAGGSPCTVTGSATGALADPPSQLLVEARPAAGAERRYSISLGASNPEAYNGTVQCPDGPPLALPGLMPAAFASSGPLLVPSGPGLLLSGPQTQFGFGSYRLSPAG